MCVFVVCVLCVCVCVCVCVCCVCVCVVCVVCAPECAYALGCQFSPPCPVPVLPVRVDKI